MKKFIYALLITFGLSFNKQTYDKPNIILIVADDLGWTTCLTWVQSIMKHQILINYLKVE